MAWRADVTDVTQNVGTGVSVTITFSDGTSSFVRTFNVQHDQAKSDLKNEVRGVLERLADADVLGTQLEAFQGKGYILDANGKIIEG